MTPRLMMLLGLIGSAVLFSGCDSARTTEQLAAVTASQKKLETRMGEQSLRIADLEAETKRLRAQVANLEEQLRRAPQR